MTSKQITIGLSIAGALSGIVAFFTYVEGQKKKKLELEVLNLDKQIKGLQLLEKQNKIAA